MIIKTFLLFFYIGVFSFGGFYASLPLVRHEFVDKLGFLTVSQFTDIILITGMAPGAAGINAATYIGYKLAGILGSFAAVLGIALPTVILLIPLMGLVVKYREKPVVKAAFCGLAPAVVALVVGTAVTLGKDTLVDIKSVIIAVIALALMRYTKLHPLYIIFGFGIVGLLL